MVAYTYNPSTRESKAGGLPQVPGQHELLDLVPKVQIKTDQQKVVWGEPLLPSKAQTVWALFN